VEKHTFPTVREKDSSAFPDPLTAISRRGSLLRSLVEYSTTVCCQEPSFIQGARTEAKAMDALKKALNCGHEQEALGAALVHCAGRGLAAAVRLLIDRGAPTTSHDASQPPGRTTPMQLAASRGHVNVVRALVEAGADRTGALEASQDLAKLGAVFAEEKKAIQAALGR